MKHEIFGISTNDDTNAFEDVFEEVYDNDCEAYYQSKKTYQHREEGLNFDYKYVVEVDDIDELTGEDTGEYGITLLMVPTFKTLCEKKQKSIAEDCEDREPDICDCVLYGTSIVLGSENVKHDNKPMDECEVLQNKLRGIANVVECIDGLRGFYLDKYVNMIGTTGWDLLHDYINGKDFVQATFARHESERQEEDC